MFRGGLSKSSKTILAQLKAPCSLPWLRKIMFLQQWRSGRGQWTQCGDITSMCLWTAEEFISIDILKRSNSSKVIILSANTLFTIHWSEVHSYHKKWTIYNLRVKVWKIDIFGIAVLLINFKWHLKFGWLLQIFHIHDRFQFIYFFRDFIFRKTKWGKTSKLKQW